MFTPRFLKRIQLPNIITINFVTLITSEHTHSLEIRWMVAFLSRCRIMQRLKRANNREWNIRPIRTRRKQWRFFKTKTRPQCILGWKWTFWHSQYKVLRSCAVPKSETFWRATGQSNLADSMEHCCTGQSAVVWVRTPNCWSFVAASRLYARIFHF